MSHDPEHSYVYVVYRVDAFQLDGLLEKLETYQAAEHTSRWRGDDPWDALIKIKEVFPDADLAEEEVRRLNEINAEKNCRYFWQGARIYPEGRKAQRKDKEDA